MTAVEQCNNLSKLATADVYIMAVSDNHVESLSNQLPFENRLVVHTSGSVPMRHLNKKIDVVYFTRCKHFQNQQN